MAFNEIPGIGIVAYAERTRAPDALWGFVHVPKTAGTSLTASLARSRGPYRNIEPASWIGGPAEIVEMRWQAVRGFVEEQQSRGDFHKYRSFSGHLMRNNADFIRRSLPETRLFTLVRDPVARAVSDYRYCLTNAHPPHEAFAAQFPTLMSYVNDKAFQNVTTRHLTGNTTATAEEAVSRATEYFDFIGDFDAYEMSISVIFTLMGVATGEIGRLNVTERTERNTFEIDDQTAAAIRRANALDEALYRHVKMVLEPQWEAWRRARPDFGDHGRRTDGCARRPHPAGLVMPFDKVGELGIVELVARARERNTLWGFAHLPKTAGTSVVQQLHKHKGRYRNIFPETWVANTDDLETMLWAAVRQFVSEQKSLPETEKYQSFSGHIRRAHAEYIREAFPDTRLFTFLRDPISRVISQYRYNLTPRHPPHEQFAKAFPTLLDFARARGSQNIMTTWLSPGFETSDEETARSICRYFSFIGTQETFAESLSIIFSMLGVDDVDVSWLNVTETTDRNRFEVDDEALETIRHFNQSDVALYRHVEGLLAPQLESWRAHIADLAAARQARTDLVAEPIVRRWRIIEGNQWVFAQTSGLRLHPNRPGEPTPRLCLEQSVQPGTYRLDAVVEVFDPRCAPQRLVISTSGVGKSQQWALPLSGAQCGSMKWSVPSIEIFEQAEVRLEIVLSDLAADNAYSATRLKSAILTRLDHHPFAAAMLEPGPRGSGRILEG